jgi:hypothetical protein
MNYDGNSGVGVLDRQESTEGEPPVMKGFNGEGRLATSLRVAAWCALAVLFFNPIGLFLGPVMPSAHVRISWDMDSSYYDLLNEAVAQRIGFGREILSTFGPYASVYTHFYHPATMWIMLLGSLLLDVCYAGCFAWLARGARLPWLFILAALFFAPLITPDAFLFSFLLLQVLVVFRLLDGGTERADKGVPVRWLVLLFASSGMLPLIKGSLVPMELGLYALCFLLFALRRQWAAALACFLAPSAGMLFFWLAAGQRIADLPSYFSGLVPVISGYSDAVSYPGPGWEAPLFLFGALAILAAIVFALQFDSQRKIFLLLAYAFYLFVTFKTGFTRQDELHVQHALGALALGSLFLTLRNPQQRRLSPLFYFIAFIVAVLPLGILWLNDWQFNFVNSFRVNGKVPSVYKELKGRALVSRFFSDVGYTGILGEAFITEPHVVALHPWTYSLRPWRDQFDEARREINASSGLNFALPGAVDAYSYEQSALFARGYAWDPRPVFQSYSAYTPQLLTSDAEHLRGSTAPDHIIFRLETIDYRLLSLDDGLSWPAMLDNYAVASDAEPWVVLNRKPGPLRTHSNFAPLVTLSAQLGQDLTMPAANGPIFVQIDLNRSTYGRLLGVLYKLPLLRLTVTTGDGHTASYRVIAGIMKTGFFLSPLVTSNEDFAHLFNPLEPTRDDEKIRTLRLDAEGKGWNNRFTVSFRQYEY